MNKYLKAGLILFSVLLILIAGVGFYVIRQLPSIASMAKALVPRATTVATTEPVTTMASIDDSAASKETTTVPASTEVSQVGADILDDLISPEKPMSDFCSSLKNAKDGVFEENEFGDAFNRSAQEGKKDPRIQAAKPLLRFVMRLPKMSEMVQEAQAAVDRNDEGFLKKAEFYAKAFSAFNEMNEHKPELEALMDRGYLFLNLNKLLAKKPELASDPRIQSYCSGVEQSFNQFRPVDFDNEKNDFLRFLDDVGVKPEDIGFDTEYKSEIDFSFSGQSLTFQGGWLSDLVQSDVEMETDLKQTH